MIRFTTKARKSGRPKRKKSTAEPIPKACIVNARNDVESSIEVNNVCSWIGASKSCEEIAPSRTCQCKVFKKSEGLTS